MFQIPQRTNCSLHFAREADNFATTSLPTLLTSVCFASLPLITCDAFHFRFHYTYFTHASYFRVAVIEY